MVSVSQQNGVSTR